MTAVLVDTSVWVNHFRELNQGVIDLLDWDAVLIHPMIVAELACGTPPSRTNTLSYMAALKQSQQASLSEVMDFIEREKLYGQGCGIVDVTLLASTLITPGAELWTMDNRLSSMAEKFDVMYCPRLH